MWTELRFRLRLMRRRARLFTRQIAVATALTATAVGLLASTFLTSSGDHPATVAQQASTHAK